MAATNYTPIQLYRTTTAAATPSAVNLADGELAINLTDEKLYFKNAGGSVKLLASSAGASGSVTSVGGTGTVNGITLTGTVTSSGSLTLGGALTGVSLTTQVTGTLPVANGGTGATSAATARTNLGATTVGGNFFTLTNPSAITFLRVNADNTVSALNAADFRTAIGVGTGTVSSVSGTGTVNGITLTGTVTSSGSLTLGGTLSGVSLTTQVTGTLPVANGGTGGTTASAARTNLGATTVGGNFFTLTNPSAITFLRVNADNTVSALNATDFRTAIGSGTVTSVSGTGTVNGLTLTGTVTSSGSLTLGGTLSGISLSTQVTGTLPVANGGTGVTTSTGTGSVVLSASPTFTGTVTTATADLLGSVRGNVTAVAASTIDCSAGNYFTKTASGGLTWTFSNAPATRSYSFLLELTNGGTGAQVWPASVDWPGGTAPTLTTSGVDVLGFITDDGGTIWRGVQLMKDSK